MVIEPRLVHVAWRCPQCNEIVLSGGVAWPVTIGSTETYACFDCAWKNENAGSPGGAG